MAAALGDAEAELNLARMYSTGHGVPRDDVEAAKWLRRAVDQGRVVAQTVLAAMYIAGRGVVKSDTPDGNVFGLPKENALALNGIF